MSQVRPTTAVIHLDALQQNFRVVREIIPAETGILAAIKGDAYGHGALECAKALERAGVDWFGVALVEEGRTLRNAGIKKPILCLGGVGPAGADAAIESNLTPVVSGLDDAEAIEKAAKSRHEPWGIHLKVDTGMGRLGVPISEWERFLDRLAEFRWLRVDGICSHLSDSEEHDGPGAVWTAEQGRRFLSAVQAARARGFHPPLLHLSNSGAILHHPQFHWDLVRPEDAKTHVFLSGSVIGTG